MVIFDSDRKAKGKNAKIKTQFMKDGEPLTSVDYQSYLDSDTKLSTLNRMSGTNRMMNEQPNKNSMFSETHRDKL